ncbi:MAG TPA: bifunctional 3-(3-hydroxy-phenyl)propionate/3-hydroxycinnamic acid hydroxylase [Streptosporangiaceae bacterium]|nr:bifunctional 3-(3-hydroxy-phenyl)propionate/3-hydroxycinnamic acid hydroxylase [Streptosporangiaceae bacterium]
MSKPDIEVPIVVIGAGPAGATAANLLGCYGVETLVIDRDSGIVDYPRAIGIDDESVRVLQTAGLAAEVMADAIQNVPLKFFDASGRCFASVQPTVREFGWYKRNIFLQPLAEAALRRGLGRFPHVQTWFGTEVTGLDQDEDGVTLHLAGRDPVRAKYVIAADGGRSGIRRQLGISLDGDTQPRQWVVVDCAADPVDAPWTGLHCDPRRPYVSARLPYGHRRWEFMLHPGENGESPATVSELLGYHLPDPASAGAVRSRVYTHHARLARTFVAGRVALAGDAAHLMPPWAGQGMNTGIRDAANLAWKLAAIVRGEAGHGLLASYDQERRPHAKAMIDLSVMLSRVLSPARRPVALARDLLLRGACLVPGAADWITQMRFKPRPRYRDGFFTGPDAGAMFIQPMVEAPGGKRMRLDEALGNWFAVVGYGCDPLARADTAGRALVERLGARVVTILESRADDARRASTRPGLCVIEDADNILRGWFAARSRDVAVLRPDRYVAALTTQRELSQALTNLGSHPGLAPGQTRATPP